MKYFTQLHSNKTVEKYDNDDSRIIIVEVTNEYVSESVLKLRNSKPPGEDTISNGKLKYGGSKLIIEITKLIKQSFLISQIPKEWKTSFVIPIFKKGDKMLPENYVGIEFLCTLLKLRTKLFSQNLIEVIPFYDGQHGFKRGRSCTEAIFTGRQITE